MLSPGPSLKFYYVADYMILVANWNTGTQYNTNMDVE